MTDAEIINWLQDHYTFFREVGLNDDEHRFELEYISSTGHNRLVRGRSLRDCVLRLHGKLELI